jgi:hypothetical protein
MLTWITNFGTARFLSLVIAAAYCVLPLLAVVGKQGSLKEVVVIVLAAAGYLVLLPLVRISSR